MASASKGRKKKRNTLLLLFVCIAAFAGGYALLSFYGEKQEETEQEDGEAEEIALLSIKEDSISRMEFKNSFGTVKLQKKENEWFLEEDRKFPLNQEYVEDMEETVLDLAALRLVTEEPEDMGEFGLEEPKITANVISSGKETVLYLGDESPSDDQGYYCRLDDDKTIYEVDADVFTVFNYSLDQMMELEDTPDITAGQVTELKIKNPNEFSFLAVNEAIGDSSSWSIQEPYESTVAGDESEITTFLGNYESFSYTGAVEYNCKDFAKYGLEEKEPGTALIKVKYYELVDVEEDEKEDAEEDTEEEEETKQERVDHEAKIVIGAKDQDGNYYVRVNDSSYVYLMDETGVDNLLPDKAYPYVEKRVSRISTDNMTKMTFTIDGKDYVITRKEKTTINDDGEEETETDYFLNSKTIEISIFNMLTVSWNTLETSKEITAKEKKQIDMENLVMTVDVKGTGRNQKVVFFALDKNYYAVKDGEDIFFLIDKREVDTLITKLQDQEAE